LEQLFQRYQLKNRVGNTSLPPKFEHGDDGTIFDKYGNLDWEQATSLLVRAYTGQIVNPAAKDAANPYESDVLDREMRLFDLVFDAAYPEEVKMAILTLIDARHQDCFGVVDLGLNASAKQAYEARINGAGVHFNTPFIGIYEPFSRIYDAYMGTDIWISPVYHVARAIALTDKNYGRHQAPAGVNRGMCPEIKELQYNLNREPAYQDLFVTYNINPIIQNRDGFVIWGQSTSYLRSSKYQDINVVRMVLKIKRDLEFSLRAFIFELNDPTTWVLMDSAISAYLGNLIAQKALNGFATKIYASDYDITQHKVRVDISLDPKMVIYQILMTISV
jgi:phage tail sheath protein FI